MQKKFKKLFAGCLVLSLIITQTLLNSMAFAESSQVKRLSGEDRYKTAAAISQKGWPKGSSYAILARGDDFADALCAGPLAKKYNAPILLTQPGELNSDAFNELKRLGAKNIIITGGVGAVSQKVEDALTLIGLSVERIWGSDRYDTAVKIAERVGTGGKIVLSTGENYPDALSISVIAAKLQMPILLTYKDSIPNAVSQYISAKKVTTTYIIGGAGVISDAVKNLAPGAVRLGGADRYETNVSVMKEFADQFNFDKLYVAVGEGPNGTEFADALSGAVLAAQTSSPIILSYKTIPQVTADFIKSKLNLGTRVIALGGEAAVPASAVDSLLAYKAEIPVKATYDKAGTYGPATGVNTIAGNVVISAPDVILQNTTIEGDLLLAESIGDGNVTLKGVTVKGKTIVNGGGPNSVIMYNFNGQTVVVDVPDGASVRLVAEGNTSVDSVEMESDGRLEESGVTGGGFINVTIPAGATVSLSGDFENVDVQAAGANVNVESGRIGLLTISESAVNSSVNLAGGSSVATLVAAAPTEVSGTGVIATANIRSNGVQIAQTPTTITRTSNVTEGSVGGSSVTNSPVNDDPPPTSGGTPPPAGGGGGGGGGLSDMSTPTVKVIASGTEYDNYCSLHSLADNVLVTSMKFGITPSDATLVIEQITGRGNNWLSSSVTKALPAGGVVTTKDLLGDLDRGTVGVSLGNLRSVFGTGNVVFTGHFEKSGYNNKPVSVTITLGGSAPSDPFDSTWATITKSSSDITVTIKVPGAKLNDIGGILPGLTDSVVWPYSLKKLPSGDLKVGEAQIKAAIETATGKTWTDVTLDDVFVKGPEYEIQITSNPATKYKLIFKK